MTNFNLQRPLTISFGWSRVLMGFSLKYVVSCRWMVGLGIVRSMAMRLIASTLVDWPLFSTNLSMTPAARLTVPPAVTSLVSKGLPAPIERLPAAGGASTQAQRFGNLTIGCPASNLADDPAAGARLCSFSIPDTWPTSDGWRRI